MDELQAVARWLETLDFSRWDYGDGEDPEDEEMRWVAERNAEPFSSQRKRVLTVVQMQEATVPLNEAERRVVNTIREIGFAAAIEWSFTNELPFCAADDFELLARAARVRVWDFWLDKLRTEYEAERFPHGTL